MTDDELAAIMRRPMRARPSPYVYDIGDPAHAINAQTDVLVAALAEARAENERLRLSVTDSRWWADRQTERANAAHLALAEAHRTLVDVEAERDGLRTENAAHIERTIFQRGELSRLASALAEAHRTLADRDALIAKARRWVANCVDPVDVGVDQKQAMLDALTASRSGAEPAAAGPECAEAFCDHDSCAKAQRDWTHAPPWGVAGAESAGEQRG